MAVLSHDCPGGDEGMRLVPSQSLLREVDAELLQKAPGYGAAGF